MSEPRPRGQEYIICAAIWVDDDVAHPHQPWNLGTGMVFAGWRHHNCFAALLKAYPRPSWWRRLLDRLGLVQALDIRHRRGECQGFLTSYGRFVLREEAARVAKNAGQIEKDKACLFSEDLY